jgi:DNA-binding NtrC family response regulator
LRLQSYPWPGNVRELKNVIERCLLLGSKPSQCLQGLMDSGDMQGGASTEGDIRLDAVEKRHILNVLDLHGGNKSAAARVLGVSRKTLERKVMAWKSSGIQEN